MKNCHRVDTLTKVGMKLSKSGEGKDTNPTYFKSLVGSLHYLICIRSDILLVSRYIEEPKMSYLKAAKHILRYIKGTLNHGLFYSSNNLLELVGYSDSDWAGDIDDQKSITGFVFFFGNTTFTWSSKKQSIITLSTCEAKYVAATSCVCHAIWLRNLLTNIQIPQKEATKTYIDNKSTIELAKNPIYHDRSKHIDIKYHFIRNWVKEKIVYLMHTKIRDQVADIFTKPLQVKAFQRIRRILGIISLEKSSLRGDVGN